MTSPAKRELLFRFLREGKSAAEGRIRSTQVLLNDPTVEGDLRESLEAIRANAEDDFGTFLHLTTVLKVPNEAKVKVTAAGDAGKVADAIGAMTLNSPDKSKLKASKPPALPSDLSEMPEDEEDEDADEGLMLRSPTAEVEVKSRVKRAAEDDEEGDVGDMDFDPLRDSSSEAGGQGLDDSHGQIEEDEEERLSDSNRKEEGDTVPDLNADPSAPTTSGRFTSTATAIAAAPARQNSNAAAVARSLPLRMPVNPMRLREGQEPARASKSKQIGTNAQTSASNAQDESDDEGPSMEIHNSIQTLAKSLHVGIMGELPSPKNFFSVYAD